MQLKRYQERVIREVRSFLDLLAKEQQEENRHATLDAWDRAKKLFALRGEYISRKNGLGERSSHLLHQGSYRWRQDALRQALANYQI